MHRNYPAILAIALFAASLSATAGSAMTVKELDRACDLKVIDAFLNKSGPDDLSIEGMIDAGRCITYISAMEDTAAALGTSLIPCQTDAEITKYQAVAVFRKWVEENPEKWHEPAAERFLKVMENAFCE